jgi:RES domain
LRCIRRRSRAAEFFSAFIRATTYSASSFNPNLGKHIEIPEEGARFNPFPGVPSANVPTLYAADTLGAAALESVFHDVEHAPGPTYPQSQLSDWSYSKLRTKRKLVFLKLVNPRLRPVGVPGRSSSITESELVHAPPVEYPHTRSWARYLHNSLSAIDGLAWRPRLGGTGAAYVFFGDRCGGELDVASPATSVAGGPGLGKIRRIARSAGIVIVET